MKRPAATGTQWRGVVLVVDDAPDMRELIRDVLTEDGYQVVTAASGGHALDEMSARVPDLVITDLLMPGIDGFGLRAEMLRRPALAGVPVIVLSSFWQRPSETLDAVEVIGKPLDLDRLLKAVRRGTSAAGQRSFRVDAADPSGPTAPATEHRAGRTHERKRDARRVQQKA